MHTQKFYSWECNVETEKRQLLQEGTEGREEGEGVRDALIVSRDWKDWQMQDMLHQAELYISWIGCGQHCKCKETAQGKKASWWGRWLARGTLREGLGGQGKSGRVCWTSEGVPRGDTLSWPAVHTVPAQLDVSLP